MQRIHLRNLSWMDELMSLLREAGIDLETTTFRSVAPLIRELAELADPVTVRDIRAIAVRLNLLPPVRLG
jgi:hypothetical protein